MGCLSSRQEKVCREIVIFAIKAAALVMESGGEFQFSYFRSLVIRL